MVKLPFNFLQYAETGLGTGIAPFWSGSWTGFRGLPYRTNGFGQFYTLENIQGNQGNFFLAHDSLFLPPTLSVRFTGQIPSNNPDRFDYSLAFAGITYPFNSVEGELYQNFYGSQSGDNVFTHDLELNITGLIAGLEVDRPLYDLNFSGRAGFCLRDDSTGDFRWSGRFQDSNRDDGTLITSISGGRFRGTTGEKANISMSVEACIWSEGHVLVEDTSDDLANINLTFVGVTWTH